ncbi:hypothetical protein pb186bvf_004471 [Paramecium bursaria]
MLDGGLIINIYDMLKNKNIVQGELFYSYFWNVSISTKNYRFYFSIQIQLLVYCIVHIIITQIILLIDIELYFKLLNKYIITQIVLFSSLQIIVIIFFYELFAIANGKYSQRARRNNIQINPLKLLRDILKRKQFQTQLQIIYEQ